MTRSKRTPNHALQRNAPHVAELGPAGDSSRLVKGRTLLLLLLFIALSVASQAAEPWEWSSDPTFERYASQLRASPYTATFTPTRLPEGVVAIQNAQGHVLYRWPAHQFSSFVIQGDRLYYSDYNPITPRVGMHCVDLGTQRQVWHVALPQDGPTFNSKYYNRVNIALRGDTLLVFSRQSWGPGQFSWRVSAATGKLLP